MTEQPTVLLAVRDKELIDQLISHLQDDKVHIVAVSDSESALAMCLDLDFSLMVVGSDLEPISGYPTSKVLRLNDRNANTPMIVLNNDAFIDATIIHDRTEYLMSHHSLLQPMEQLYCTINSALKAA